MKKIISLIIVFSLSLLTLLAQSDKKKSVVELKSGATLIGFVEHQSGGVVIVTTDDGDIIYFTQNEIRQITVYVSEEEKQALKKKEEEEKLRKQKAEEEERLRKQQAAEAERLRKQKEQEERLRIEKEREELRLRQEQERLRLEEQARIEQQKREFAKRMEEEAAAAEQRRLKEQEMQLRAEQERILQEERKTEKSKKRQELKENTGYFGTVENITSVTYFTSGAYTVQGVHFGRFAMGIGAGFRYIKYVSFTDYGLPIYAHMSCEFMKTKVSPYIAVNAGYDVLDPLMFIQFSAGVDIGFGKKSSSGMRLGAGYDLKDGFIINVAIRF